MYNREMKITEQFRMSFYRIRVLKMLKKGKKGTKHVFLKTIIDRKLNECVKQYTEKANGN